MVTILWNQQVRTSRTIPNNKPDIIICDNKKGTCILIDVAIPGDRNVIKKEAEKILKIWRRYNRNSAHVECESKGDMSSNKGDWNYFIITQTFLSNISGKHEIKELQNSHTGHWTHTTKSANGKVQNIFHGRNYITCSTNCKYRTAAIIHTIETWFVSCV